MKQNIVSPHKELGIPDEYYDNKLPCSAADIDAVNIYRLTFTYASPFMPMVDLTVALEELMKLFKEWLASKKKETKQLL